MDWNSSATGNGNGNGNVNLPNDPSFTFLYNCNVYDQYSGTAATAMSGSTETFNAAGAMSSYGSSASEKKKRLTNEQLESLERSFQEEIKLDPDRKTRLSRELGLQPRQVAVWFQNRRARWKTKQLERLYDGLKQEFDAISREKLSLQQEVVKLKSMLREQGGGTVTMRKKVMASSAADRASGDQTVESSWRRYESALIT